jgi:hypothetical protein
MKIITAEFNECLNTCSWFPMIINNIGGTVRIVAGVAQVVLNAVALVFSALASCCLKKDHWFHISTISGDLGVGLEHICRGALEQIPYLGYFFFSEMDTNGKCIDSDGCITGYRRPLEQQTDRPFYWAKKEK